MAIIGAGRLGSALAEELFRNPESVHEPVCFIDVDSQKIGREIETLKVLPEDTNPKLLQTDFGVQQIIFAVPDMDHDRRRQLVEKYTTSGFKVLQYTVPAIERADKKPVLKEFAVEDLLFRMQQIIVDENTEAYYKDKVILVTGGGGSIGSEICRQLACMQPKKIIILDIYENCTYDITDKRIIRYFMTIPEASQLVLTSGAMAKNGELFVLDMGKPVKILDLAQNMIKLSGAHDIEIIETGLRPGEKLYEELLIKTEELDKTDNSLIFIERDTPLAKEEINQKLEVLRKACASNDDDAAREALRSVVPTFKRPEEVNKDVK